MDRRSKTELRAILDELVAEFGKPLIRSVLEGQSKRRGRKPGRADYSAKFARIEELYRELGSWRSAVDRAAKEPPPANAETLRKYHRDHRLAKSQLAPRASPTTPGKLPRYLTASHEALANAIRRHRLVQVKQLKQSIDALNRQLEDRVVEHQRSVDAISGVDLLRDLRELDWMTMLGLGGAEKVKT